ncbi:MAG: collagen binding domain-containing protein, partial [Oscillospiraceae bacterium]
MKLNNTAVTPDTSTTEPNATFSLAMAKDSGGTYPQINTVTYSTKVDDNYFDNATEIDEQLLKNKAWLKFTWHTYDGEGPDITDWTPPTIDKGVAVDTNLLHKNGIYNPATHEITWTVTVNPHGVDVVSGTITDDPSLYVQSYVAGSFSSANPTITLNSSGTNNLSVNVGALGKTTGTFSFKTLVNNAEHYAYNTPNGVVYQNRADFDGFVKVSGADQKVTSNASGTVVVNSKVLEKKSLGYDYSTNKIKWQITLNHNNMPMAATVLTDTLSAGQSYVNGSAMIDGVAIDSRNIGFASQVLTLTLNDVNKQSTITYETLVDTSTPDFKSKTELNFTNSVTLKRTGYNDLSIPAVSQRVSNNVLQKIGTLSTDKSSIAYRIDINPNGISLPTDCKLKDTIPKGLQVDIDSITLYNATVDDKGSFTKGTQHSNANTSGFLTYDTKSSSFSVAMPQGTNRYILEYTCDITDPNIKSFRNSIQFVGGGFSGNTISDGSSITLTGASGGGSGGASTKGSLHIVKNDTMRTGVKLAGVEFTLSTDIGGTPFELMSGKTDSNGELTFFPLNIGRTYTVAEKTPLAGYTKDS